MNTIILKHGREKSLLRHHPWVFSGAVQRVLGRPVPGETVEVVASDGRFLGRGAWSPKSQIQVRMWTFDPDEEISTSFFHRRLETALQSRRKFRNYSAPPACRLVNAESDGLPGLIADAYGDYIVCQFGSTGTEFWKNGIADSLRRLWPCEGIYERSDISARDKEGLPRVRGLLAGKEPPELLEIAEGPCRFFVDIREGQKTGFFSDQRDNRRILHESCMNDKKDAEVLDCFSYSGGFGINALMGGAKKVTCADTSATALELLRKNAELNQVDTDRLETVEGDVFSLLRQYREEDRQFDMVVLDPPKFADAKKSLNAAARAYKDINLLGFRLLRPRGLLFTFSCSGLMDTGLFQKIVADAALDAGREGQIIRRLDQAGDHPVALNFPEGQYLKGLLCTVLT